MTPIVWAAVGFACVVFAIFAGWPLYRTYQTRGLGADDSEARAYFTAKAERERAAAGQPAARGGQPGPGHGQGPSAPSR